MRTNPFQRGAYSSYSANYKPKKASYSVTDYADKTFSGHDHQVYFNDTKVGNAEAISWTTSTETVSNHVMGRRDPVAFTQGKRVVVGSLVLQEFAQHAFLHEIWRLHESRLGVIGDLWNLSQGTNGLNLSNGTFDTTQVVGSNALGGGFTYQSPDANNLGGLSNFRGLSATDLQAQLKEQIIDAASAAKNVILQYADQIPPFDITLVGVNKSGAARKCTLFGVQITQETGGISQADMGGQMGMAFVALAVSPWTALTVG